MKMIRKNLLGAGMFRKLLNLVLSPIEFLDRASNKWPSDGRALFLTTGGFWYFAFIATGLAWALSTSFDGKLLGNWWVCLEYLLSAAVIKAFLGMLLALPLISISRAFNAWRDAGKFLRTDSIGRQLYPSELLPLVSLPIALYFVNSESVLNAFGIPIGFDDGKFWRGVPIAIAACFGGLYGCVDFSERIVAEYNERLSRELRSFKQALEAVDDCDAAFKGPRSLRNYLRKYGRPDQFSEKLALWLQLRTPTSSSEDIEIFNEAESIRKKSMLEQRETLVGRNQLLLKRPYMMERSRDGVSHYIKYCICYDIVDGLNDFLGNATR